MGHICTWDVSHVRVYSKHAQFEPHCAEMLIITYAGKVTSDQHGHPRSLIRSNDISFLIYELICDIQAYSVTPDQTE